MVEALLVVLPGNGAATERFTHGGIGFCGTF